MAELEESAANSEFDYWFLEGLPYGQTNRLEGFLFPDTYDFYVGDDPDRVLDKLLTNFNRKFSDDAVAQLDELNTWLAERWSAKGYDESYIEAHKFTVYELITVASMIEKETAGASESGGIASVIYNRLCDPANNPYLNIDATIVYALGGAEGALTYEDTQIDSPYNTYNRTGRRRAHFKSWPVQYHCVAESLGHQLSLLCAGSIHGEAPFLRDARGAPGVPGGPKRRGIRDEAKAGAAGPRRGHGAAENGGALWRGRGVFGGRQLWNALFCGKFYPGGTAGGRCASPMPTTSRCMSR